ncbi:hypothetical protein P2H44_22650 [Albimonas sp. CAU 1670]|uniref:hypothetical protein n=1 Tax=Albimonas sp. CAU 1670 TaxID=3032599 RepID=UPI0023DB2D4E|nr:hypothetical protein [Albimonas sp. CAU 1670]MDF2235365.1 hypothetical protein [Albimonas sp. CAU 1670]
MTVEAFTSAETYTIMGRGPYAVRWPYGSADDLLVEVVIAAISTPLILDYNFEVTPSPIDGEAAPEGEIKLSQEVADAYEGCELRISREGLIEQGWASAGGPRETGLERQLDRQVRILQDLRDRIGRWSDDLGRVLRVPSYEEAIKALPEIKARAGRLLAFDGTGRPTVWDGTVTVTATGSHVFSTMIAAALLVIPAPLQRIEVHGHSVENDGGHGAYARWVAPDEETTTPAHLGWFTDAAGQIWELDEANARAEQFGAKRDAVTDDIAALRACEDYCHVMGATMRLLGGTYAIGDVWQPDGHEAINIVGAGMTKTALLALSASAGFRPMDCARGTIRDVLIRCESVAPYGIRLRGSGAGNVTSCGGWVIERVWVTGATTDHFRFDGQADNWSWTNSRASNLPEDTSNPFACVRSDTVGRMLGGTVGGTPGWGLHTTTQNEENGDPSKADADRVSAIGTRFNACGAGFVLHDGNGEFTNGQHTTLFVCYFENCGVRYAGAVPTRDAIAFWATNGGGITISGSRKLACNYAKILFRAELGSVINYYAASALQGGQVEQFEDVVFWACDETSHIFIHGELRFREKDLNKDKTFTPGKGSAVERVIPTPYFTDTLGQVDVFQPAPGRDGFGVNFVGGKKLYEFDGTSAAGWTPENLAGGYPTTSTAAGTFLTKGSSIHVKGDGVTLGVNRIKRKLYFPEYALTLVAIRAAVFLKLGTVSHPRVKIWADNEGVADPTDYGHLYSGRRYEIDLLKENGDPTGETKLYELGQTELTEADAGEWRYLQVIPFIVDASAEILVSITIDAGSEYASNDELYIDRVEAIPFTHRF